jgi:hypothetical protein
MGSERRKQILLLALAAVLVVVAGYEWWSSSSPETTTADGSATSNVRGSSRTQAVPQLTAPDVHLAELSAEHPTPDSADRNLFRFKERPLPPPPPRPIAPPVVAPMAPVRSGPPPPPPVPPIRLKFIGYIQTENGQKIALLSDGLGRPEHVLEGGTALGQYKIWRIGVESIDISYLDGRGRQTIRLNGQ